MPETLMHPLMELEEEYTCAQKDPEFQSELMKAAKKGVVKKKSVSRKISRVSKKIKNLKT